MNYRIIWSNCSPVLLLLLLCFTGSADAARSLYWKSLQVNAELDTDGSLHVTERHHIVFTGDWNGGERTFRVASGQTLQLDGVYRIDPGSASRHPLTSGKAGRRAPLSADCHHSRTANHTFDFYETLLPGRSRKGDLQATASTGISDRRLAQ